ncbi:MAG: hypothetical protein J5620_02170 [Alphaproteobacteria bacterium]|nr:hypothetical protein [Alphaproteobacteria bacterium]
MRRLLFIAISSMLVVGVTFADTKTVTTKDYVDTALEAKQDTIPAGTYGANGSVVTYGATAGDVDERFILDSSQSNMENLLKTVMSNGSADLSSATIQRLLGKTGEELNNSIVPAKYIVHGLNAKQYAITPGTTGSVAIFNGADQRGGSQFTERAIYDGSTTYDSTTDADKLITAGAVETKQNRMTCARYLDNAEQTDENCLLWSVAN